MKSSFEEHGGTYTFGEDGIFYPNIVIGEDEEPRYGKYGMLRKSYLKEHKRNLYDALLLSGKLTAHLNNIDKIANERKELLIETLKQEKGITEMLKETDWLKWLREVSLIQQSAEEIVLQDFIYC